MIKTFEGTSIVTCAKEASEWLDGSGWRVSNTQIHNTDKYNVVLVLTCESWYHIAKYGK